MINESGSGQTKVCLLPDSYMQNGVMSFEEYFICGTFDWFRKPVRR